MDRILTTVGAATALFAASPAWACMPMPPDADHTMEISQTVVVGRITAVEQTPPAACISAAKARADHYMPGDPGESGCVNFGFATVEPVRFIKGDSSDDFRVAYNSREFCAVGWAAEVGQLVLITVPNDLSTLRAGSTASLEGGLQYETRFRTIIDDVAASQP